MTTPAGSSTPPSAAAPSPSSGLSSLLPLLLLLLSEASSSGGGGGYMGRGGGSSSDEGGRRYRHGGGGGGGGDFGGGGGMEGMGGLAALGGGGRGGGRGGGIGGLLGRKKREAAAREKAVALFGGRIPPANYRAVRFPAIGTSVLSAVATAESVEVGVPALPDSPSRGPPMPAGPPFQHMPGVSVGGGLPHPNTAESSSALIMANRSAGKRQSQQKPT